MIASQLFQYVPLGEDQAVPTAEYTHIAHRTEQITPGCIYVHLYPNITEEIIHEIEHRQAGLLVIAESLSLPDTPLLYLRVKSPRLALSHLWSNLCGRPQDHMKMVGITGTNGKTSCATLLEWALRQAGHKTALLGTADSLICGEPYVCEEYGRDRLTTMTTPDPDILYPYLAAARDRGVEFVVMEVSSHALSQEKVAPIQYAEAIFTNLTPEHLDFHQNMQEYGKTKERLFQNSQHATINCDDAYGEELAGRLSCPVTTCGCVWEGDARATQVECTIEGTSYFLRYGKLCTILHLELCGVFSVYNSMLAAISAIHLGVIPTVAFRALESHRGVKGRLERVSEPDDPIQVYIDYAHTEAALRQLLHTVRHICHGRLWLVFGCGGNRDRTKRAPMGRCAADLADYTVITSDNPRKESKEAIIEDILAGHNQPKKRTVIYDRREAIHFAIAHAQKGDVVLLVGKGHEEYEILGSELLPFHEREIAKEALKLRELGHTRAEETR